MKVLYFFVEGEDDELFIERVIRQRLGDIHSDVIKYAQRPRIQIGAFARAIGRQPNCEIFVLADKDNAPCFTERKQQVVQRFDNEIAPQSIVIVETSIEAWYLAGLPNKNSLKLEVPPTTDSVNKQQFNTILKDIQKRRTLIEIKLSILSEWKWDVALQRNRSFKYFAHRLGLV